MIVYFNGRFLPQEEVKISPDDRGFLFADGVYEVICAYGGRLFKAAEHFRRLKRGLRELRIEGVDVEGLGAVVARLIRVNGLGDSEAKVYIQVTRGVAPRAHAFPGGDTSPTVYVAVSPFQRRQDRCERGVKIILVPDIRWTRCDIKSLALLPNVLASQRAKEEGAVEAVFVRDGAVTEGSHTSICAVFDGRLFTYPKSHYILGGITREVVLELCRKLEIPVVERPVLESRLKDAEEIMLLGTTSGILPVIQVDGWRVGDGEPGPVTRRLQQAFLDLAC